VAHRTSGRNLSIRSGRASSFLMRSPKSSTAGGDKEETLVGLLTCRERQVAGLIALGHTNAEVGRLLQIHQKTVETHRNRVMTKLCLGSRADLVRFALAQGLVNNGPGGRFFQCCTGCNVLWSLRSQFLSDREVTFHGFQPAEAVNSPGALIFLHGRCGTKLSVALETFIELAGEPLLTASCAQKGVAPEYCLAKATLQPRPLKCVCAFVWRTSHIVSQWPKGVD